MPMAMPNNQFSRLLLVCIRPSFIPGWQGPACWGLCPCFACVRPAGSHLFVPCTLFLFTYAFCSLWVGCIPLASAHSCLALKISHWQRMDNNIFWGKVKRVIEVELCFFNRHCLDIPIWSTNGTRMTCISNVLVGVTNRHSSEYIVALKTRRGTPNRVLKCKVADQCHAVFPLLRRNGSGSECLSRCIYPSGAAGATTIQGCLPRRRYEDLSWFEHTNSEWMNSLCNGKKAEWTKRNIIDDRK